MKGRSEERHKKLEISRDTMLRAVGHVILRIFYVTVSVYWVTIHKPRNRYIRRRRVPLAEVYWQISSCCPQDFDEQNIQVGSRNHPDPAARFGLRGHIDDPQP